jgi:anti-anti-sigma regulatory factor
MMRRVVNAIGFTRALAAVGALGVALPAAASSSAQPSWIAPALLALAIVGLAVVALRAAAPAERAVVGKDGRGAGVFVVTRDAVARRETPAPITAAAAELRPPPVAPVDATPRPDVVLRRLSARMDTVTYEPGAPNVLSMTKRLADDGAAGLPAVTCTRGDADGEIVLALEGALDAVTLGDVAPVLDAVVASHPAAVVLELSSLRSVDAAGAKAIGRLAARLREGGGQVRAVGLARQPRAVFRLLELDRALRGA